MPIIIRDAALKSSSGICTLSNCYFLNQEGDRVPFNVGNLTGNIVVGETITRLENLWEGVTGIPWDSYLDKWGVTKFVVGSSDKTVYAYESVYHTSPLSSHASGSTFILGPTSVTNLETEIDALQGDLVTLNSNFDSLSSNVNSTLESYNVIISNATSAVATASTEIATLNAKTELEFVTISNLKASTEYSNARKAKIQENVSLTNYTPGVPLKEYVFSAASTAEDNGYTILRPDDISAGNPGRWISRRVIEEGRLNVLDFGAIPIRQTDSVAAQALVATNNRLAFEAAYAAATFWGATLEVPSFSTEPIDDSRYTSMVYYIDDMIVWDWLDSTYADTHDLLSVVGGGILAPKTDVDWTGKALLWIKGSVADINIKYLAPNSSTGNPVGYVRPFSFIVISRGGNATDRDQQRKEIQIWGSGTCTGPALLLSTCELLYAKNCRIGTTEGSPCVALWKESAPGFTGSAEIAAIGNKSFTKVTFHECTFFCFNNLATATSFDHTVELCGYMHDIAFQNCYTYVERGAAIVLYDQSSPYNRYGVTCTGSQYMNNIRIENLYTEHNVNSFTTTQLEACRSVLVSGTYVAFSNFNGIRTAHNTASGSHLIEVRDNGAIISSDISLVTSINYTGTRRYPIKCNSAALGIQDSNIRLNTGAIYCTAGAVNNCLIWSHTGQSEIVTLAGGAEGRNMKFGTLNVGDNPRYLTLEGLYGSHTIQGVTPTLNVSGSNHGIGLPFSGDLGAVNPTTATIADWTFKYIRSAPPGATLYLRNSNSSNNFILQADYGSQPDGWGRIRTDHPTNTTITVAPGGCAILKQENATTTPIWRLIGGSNYTVTA